VAKRGHNEGSIYQRKDGRWVAVLTVKDLAGRANRVSRYADTRTRARAALRELQRQQEAGVDLTAGNPTLGAYLMQWLTAVAGTVKPRVWDSYESIIRVRVIPRIGGLKLSQVTPLVLQGLYAALAADGLAPRSVVNTHRLLHRALGQAVRWGLLPRNACDGAEPPRPGRPVMKTWGAEQVAAFLAATREHRHHALYVLAVTTGMRLGELLALGWDAVDFEYGRVHVVRSLQRRTGVGLVFGDPKTDGSRRTVFFSEQARAALREQRARQLEERLLAGPLWQEHGLVFARPDGLPHDPGTVSQSFGRAARTAGIPHIRFHDLRHTAATLLLGAGTHPKIVADLLGHSTVALTLNVYSHVTPAMHASAAATMDALLGS